MSSYQENRDNFLSINPEIYQRYQDGDPVHIIGADRPVLEVVSFDPFSYQEYTFFHRAPLLSGRLAVRQLITMPGPNGTAHVLAGVERGNTNSGYGVRVTLDAFNTIAELVGRSDVRAKFGW